jgi:hypothetical protein
MNTDESNEQEAPGVQTPKTEEEDTEGHVRTAMGGDPDFDARPPSVRPGATDDDDDTEGHVKAGAH